MEIREGKERIREGGEEIREGGEKFREGGEETRKRAGKISEMNFYSEGGGQLLESLFF